MLEDNLRLMERARERYRLRYPATSPGKLRRRPGLVDHPDGRDGQLLVPHHSRGSQLCVGAAENPLDVVAHANRETGRAAFSAAWYGCAASIRRPIEFRR